MEEGVRSDLSKVAHHSLLPIIFNVFTNVNVHSISQNPLHGPISTGRIGLIRAAQRYRQDSDSRTSF
ncbi:hypothetical protein L6452_17376 [Arctium lappa]|uniref:Uncharacterized protein n=1 Tax=Arctium lappa TaxID=4217 RepID=A0ACB9C383_ARCLA|nr:hypothetical protein L6452_17376 [Arctium lappa]